MNSLFKEINHLKGSILLLISRKYSESFYVVFKQGSSFINQCKINIKLINFCTSFLLLKLVEGLLKYWPFANSAKEMMFLNEVLEVLEVCEITKLEPLVNKLFKRLIKCIAGSHLQVCDINM